MKNFEEALGDLINEYMASGATHDAIISALELAKMALEEEEEEHDA